MKLCLYIVLALAAVTSLQAYERGTIDTVISYKWGAEQNSGQSPDFFPKNIFGKPDTSASETMPASNPSEVCSLGLGGEITVAFKGFEIVDAPGVDFTIFENAFLNPVTNKLFVEPAVVSVSYDGIHFTQFPFDSLTLDGCAGITPTHGKEDCFNPELSGGDGFDLATIGLQSIRYIRIKDISQIVLNYPQHPFYDPTITGFDLDAVCGLHLVKTSTNIPDKFSDENFKIFTLAHSVIINTAQNNLHISIFDLAGNKIYDVRNKYQIRINNLQSGIYFIIAESKGEIIIKRKIIL